MHFKDLSNKIWIIKKKNLILNMIITQQTKTIIFFKIQKIFISNTLKIIENLNRKIVKIKFRKLLKTIIYIS